MICHQGHRAENSKFRFNTSLVLMYRTVTAITAA
uniref:Uncharacterized protein n=1 Tax=Arundo donax TaxID=35708 RepID=A0A0A9AA69_ARUDO